MTSKKDVTPFDREDQVPATLTDIYAELAGEGASVEEEPGGLTFVSTRNGRFTLDDEALTEPWETIVLARVYVNTYYDEDFDPDDPQPPACFALATQADRREMAPHENSSEPQHDRCKGCWANEFGSADRGKGKACKNGLRLAVIDANEEPEIIRAGEAEVLGLTLPPTAFGFWQKYVNTKLGDVRGLPFAVMTGWEMADMGTYDVPTPKRMAVITDPEVLHTLAEQARGAEELLLTPFQTDAEEPEEEGEEEPKGDDNPWHEAEEEEPEAEEPPKARRGRGKGGQRPQKEADGGKDRGKPGAGAAKERERQRRKPGTSKY